MTLDTPTLFTCVMIAEFAGSAILLLFLLLWRARSRACALSLGLCSVGMFLAGSGTFLIALRGTVPESISILAANALLIFGTGLRRCGIAAFLGKRPLIWVVTGAATLWLALCFYPPFFESFLARVNYVQACLILSCLSIVAMTVRFNREKLHSIRFLGVTTLIECAAYVWYTVNQNLLRLPDFLTAFSEDFMSIFLVTVLFAMIMTIVLQVSMVVERSLQGFRDQALQDALTNLPNRRAFYDAAEAWISGRQESGGRYCLIVFDIDRFKSVNDRYSQAMGDAILQLFSRVLKDSLSAEAVCGRVGGEEFAVFLPDCDKEFALLTTQRLCRRFSVGCQQATDGKLVVTASAGIATAECSIGLARAMEAAVNGLGKAKRQGKAQIVSMDLLTNGLLKKSTAAAFSRLKRKAA